MPLLLIKENLVSKAKKTTTKKKSKTDKLPAPAPWISMPTGLRIVAVASIGMAVLTAWEVVPQKGWLEGIFWGLLFGALIWIIFFGMLYFNRWIRR